MICIALVSSCSYSLSTEGDEEDDNEVSIAYLKSLYAGHPVTITNDYVIKGYTASTDRYGNYYKSVVIEDDTGGIEIKLDKKDLFKLYPVGGMLKVHCNALTLGSYGGALQLGSAPEGGYETGHIRETDISARIHSTTDGAKSTLKKVMIAGMSQRYINCLVRIESVQFVEGDGETMWCENNEDTNRTLIDVHGNILSVRTSARASFAGWPLPPGSGYIDGILTYFNGNYQLKVTNPANMDMEDERF